MKKLFLKLVAFTFIPGLYAQTVSTFFSDQTKKVDDALAIDFEGNIYGSNYMGSNVYKITPDGTSTVFASGFNTPNGLAFDSQYNLYVCDMQGGRIYKISHDGLFLDTITIPNPSGIIKSLSSDTMIFTQYQSHIVNKLAPDGTIIPISSGTPLNGPVGLSYDDNGTLYVANFNDRKIYSLVGASLNYIATVPGPTSGWLGFITFAKGSLWGTGYNDHKIYQINPYFTDSVVSYLGTTAGSTDGDVDTAQFNKPNGIMPSITGDSLFVSDFGSGRIRIIAFDDVSGTIELKNISVNSEIYPNPTSAYITIECEGKLFDMQLQDAQGRLLLSSSEKKIDLSTFPAGIYLVSIKTELGRAVKKVIKN